MQNKQEISHSLSKDLKFLIACCQTKQSDLELNSDNPVVKTKEGCIDTDFILNYLSEKDEAQYHNLITLATQHGILPLVHKTLQSLDSRHPELDSGSHSTLLTELKAHYMSISQRNMLMSAELIHIMKLLKENNIDALAFKGPALSQMAYGDITLRQFGDLDILIRKKDRSKMMDLLLQERYIPEINLKVGTKETFFNSVNVIGLHNKTSFVFVEMHWELLSKNYAIDWEEASLWEKKKSIQINNKNIAVLPIEQFLLYLCAHGSKHLFERLEWICDINRTVRSTPDIDWIHLLKEAEKLGTKRMLCLGLALSQLFFYLKLPDMIQNEIKKDHEVPKLISKVIKINFSEAAQKGKSYSSFGLLWSMRENLSDQLRFAWRGLFAPKFDDFLFIQLPKHLTFLYPIVRPFRLVIKYFKH